MRKFRDLEKQYLNRWDLLVLDPVESKKRFQALKKRVTLAYAARSETTAWRRWRPRVADSIQYAQSAWASGALLSSCRNSFQCGKQLSIKLRNRSL